MIHDAYLPPPLRVASIELREPISPIAGCASFRAVRVLVRLDRQPLGWLTIPEPGDVVAVARIQTQLVRQLPTTLRNASLRRELALTRPIAPRPPISVVVCTRDRATSLERCLDSLSTLDYADFEVIVVDNAPSTAETEQLVATFAARLPLRYIREDCPGLDWARNRGIAEARHGIVAFTDDDVRVDAHWLTGLADAFADPETMLVTGLVAPAELETSAQILFEFGYGGMGKGLTAKRWQRDTLSTALLIGAHHLGVGANMAFRRSTFERVGLFDTALDVGTPSRGGGDLDMFHRVLISGAVVRYEPRALVWHSHRRESSALERQLQDNGRAFGVYLLTCATHGDIPRSAVARYTASVWLAWLGGRLIRRFARREVLPLRLQAAELWGIAHAPLAYIATRRSDRRLRSRLGADGRTGGQAGGQTVETTDHSPLVSPREKRAP